MSRYNILRLHFFLTADILVIEVFVLRYFIEKEEIEKKKYAIDHNRSFVVDYDYIAFRYDKSPHTVIYIGC